KKDELIAAFREAAAGPMKGILAVADDPMVSVDFKGNPHSSIVDAEFTQVMSETMIKVMTWYDNEWGYSVRCADLMILMGKML
ncbi:MAG TPA: type I glyceraldehyde-3-phosphate dehydrogenase, partial [Aggregatilineales bacterium]|nr:type I glyceraldehyde-3-phosphate dehydrogenase [Aggregatilineales bacterium]